MKHHLCQQLARPGCARLRSAASVLALSLFLPVSASAQNQVDVAVGDLPSGGTITIEIVVTAPDPAPAGVDAFSTQGTVSGGNFADVDTDDPDGAGAADPTLTNLNAAPELGIAKSYTGPIPQPGDTIAFDLDFANDGNQGATGVTISETVPANTTFNLGASTPGWSCADGSPAGTPCDLVIGGLAGAGAGASAVFAVDLDDPLPPGTGSLVNTATIADDGANGADPDPGDNSDTETVTLDALAPTVPSVDTITPGGLTECATSRVAVDGLVVTFSEQMNDPPGNGDPDDVTNPANYLLVDAGPNHAYDTFACGGAGGDDVEVPITGVGYDSGTQNATVDLGGYLADGLHRLFVCAAITDLAGNPLDGDGDGTGGDDLVRSFRIDFANLFGNGHFDCDDGGWTAVSTPGATQAHDPAVDADGSSDSGSEAVSVLVAGGQAEQAALGQCVALVPGGLDLAGRARLDVAMDGVVSLTLGCDYHPQSACAAAPIGSDDHTTVFADTGGGFVAVGAGLIAPAGAASALCAFTWNAPAGVTFDGWLDALSATGPIFVDGFESGDTSAWSSTTQVSPLSGRSPRGSAAALGRREGGDTSAWSATVQ